MKYKIMALLVPLILVLSGVGAATGSFAEGSTPSPSQSDCKEFVIGQDFFLKTNESEYVNYSYTSTWKIGDGVLLSYTHTYKADESKYVDTKTARKSVEDNGITYTLVKDTMVGLYKVSTGGAAAADGSTTISWDLSVTVKQGETEKTISVNSMDVEVKPVSPASVVIDAIDSGDMPVVGQVYNHQMTAKIGGSTVGGSAIWYAIGLPEGLSMSSDGHVNGVAKASTGGNVSVNVAISVGCIVYTGAFDISVGAGEALAFKMYIEDGSDDPAEIGNGNFFMGIKGSSYVLAIKDSVGNGIDSSRLDVRAVDNDGAVASLEYAAQNGGVPARYLLPNNGTGAYLITVTMAGVGTDGVTQHTTQSFTFYNLPPGVISADIIVNGN